MSKCDRDLFIGGGPSNVLNRAKRDSNMELFRIVATFLIIVVHASFFTLGMPTQEDIATNAVSSFTRFFVQAISIVSVNAFVLLSGWFGIRPKASSFLNFVFQILFWAIGIYVICLICGFAKFNEAECCIVFRCVILVGLLRLILDYLY